MLTGDEPHFLAAFCAMTNLEQIEILTIQRLAQNMGLDEWTGAALSNQIVMAFHRVRDIVGKIDAVVLRGEAPAQRLTVIGAWHTKPVVSVVGRANIVMSPALRDERLIGPLNGEFTWHVLNTGDAKVKPLVPFRWVIMQDAQANVARVRCIDHIDAATVKILGNQHVMPFYLKVKTDLHDRGRRPKRRVMVLHR